MLNVRVFSVLVLSACLSGCVSRTLSIPGYEPKTFSMSRQEAHYVDAAIQGEEAHSANAKERCAYWKAKGFGNKYEIESEFIQTAQMVWCDRVRTEKTPGERQEERDVAEKKKAEEAARRDAPARKAREAAHREQQAVLTRVLEKELASDRCTDERAAKWQQVLAGFGQTFATMRDEAWRVEDSKILVLTKEPKPLDIDPAVGGEIHVFGLGFAAVHLHVTDDNGYPVAMHSTYEEIAAWTGAAADSRSFRSSGRGFNVSAAGGGCSLVVVMRKL